MLLLGCNFMLLVLFGDFVTLGAFWCFFVRAKTFRKKKKTFKTALMTSFILLLTKEAMG